MLFENQRTWGQPDFSKAQAKDRLGLIASTERAAGDLELSEETAENLEELGYL
jgi:septum formation topological specificity factor MinE